MANLNKIYHFSRFQRGPTFSRGVQLIPGGGDGLTFRLGVFHANQISMCLDPHLN